MKKIIAIIFLSIISFSAVAQNLHCNSQPSSNQVYECYAGQMRLDNYELNVFVGQMLAHPMLTAEYKRNFQRDHDKWVTDTNKRCNSDIRCLYVQVGTKRNEYGRQLNGLDARAEAKKNGQDDDWFVGNGSEK